MQKVKSKKAVTKKKTARRAVPYDLIARMAEAGDDVLTIARKVGRVNAGPDKTHTLRALLARMRIGWRDENGKTHKLIVKRVGHAEKPIKRTEKARKRLTIAKKATTKPKPPEVKIENSTLPRG